jgi:hypothetical protein
VTHHFFIRSAPARPGHVIEYVSPFAPKLRADFAKARHQAEKCEGVLAFLAMVTAIICTQTGKFQGDLFCLQEQLC